MNLDFRNGQPLAAPRTPDVIPVGKFEGVRICSIETSELRTLQKEFFRRDPVLQQAIAQEISRRRHRRAARGSSISRRGKNVGGRG
ncbi:MAG: hypothetical protein ACLQPN_22495 [Bryobacteraceae bacterium]